MTKPLSSLSSMFEYQCRYLFSMLLLTIAIVLLVTTIITIVDILFIGKIGIILFR